MPRLLRRSQGGVVYHVLNRSCGRAKIFREDGDYAAFEEVLIEAATRSTVRVLSFCLMPNHWHLVLWPTRDGELSEYMRWLTVTHVQRWHANHRTGGTGHLYQGRFKSFEVATDDHFLRVCRYVERNALRAGLVNRAEAWRWSSLWWRLTPHPMASRLLAEWPVERGDDWTDAVNQPETPSELEAIRTAILKSVRLGD